MKPYQMAADLRRMLRGIQPATVSSVSADPDTVGIPVTSITVIALDGVGDLLVLVPDGSDHARNFVADPRGSVFVRETSELFELDHWSIAVTGTMTRQDDEYSIARLQKSFCCVSRSDPPVVTCAWRLRVNQVCYCSGFTGAYTLSGDEYRRPAESDGFREREAKLLAMINAGWRDGLLDCCRGFARCAAAAAEAVRIDATGLFVRTRRPRRLHFLSFIREIRPDEVEPELARLHREALEFLE